MYAIDGNTKCKQCANLARPLRHRGKLLFLNIIYSGNLIAPTVENVDAGKVLTKFVIVNRWKLSKFVVANVVGDENGGIEPPFSWQKINFS
jgi:hypothetical protein